MHMGSLALPINFKLTVGTYFSERRERGDWRKKKEKKKKKKKKLRS